MQADMAVARQIWQWLGTAVDVIARAKCSCLCMCTCRCSPAWQRDRTATKKKKKRKILKLINFLNTAHYNVDCGCCEVIQSNEQLKGVCAGGVASLQGITLEPQTTYAVHLHVAVTL